MGPIELVGPVPEPTMTVVRPKITEYVRLELTVGSLFRPAVRRVDDGIPARVDRVRSLGNAVCPPVAQWLGERIVSAHIDGSPDAGTMGE